MLKLTQRKSCHYVSLSQLTMLQNLSEDISNSIISGKALFTNTAKSKLFKYHMKPFKLKVEP